MTTPRTLPSPPDASPGATVHGYGLELFAFVLREGVTATLTDEQIELARHASIAAVTGYGKTPEAPAALERIQTTRALLTTVSGYRTAQAAEDAQDADQAPEDAQDGPSGGQRAPLIPTPDTEPPAPAMATTAPTTPPAFDFDAEPF
jgi:hypothetical protein